MVADPPVEGAREFLEEVVDHFEVNVFSARSHQHDGIAAMTRWCQEHFGIKLTNQLFFPVNKPPAFLSIDDRAIRFTGSWPTAAECLSYKPWYKE